MRHRANTWAGDGGVQSGQPVRVHALGGHLRLADEHRPAELPRVVRGVPLNSVSLIFIVAGGLIFVSGIRAFAALPAVSAPSAR
jgi:hypothetical protein